MKRTFNKKSILLFLFFGAVFCSQAQVAGFMPLYKAEVNFHRSTGFELGLLAFNYIPKGTNFLEASISTEAIFKEDLLLIPKLNFEGGTTFTHNGLLMLVGGINLGFPTNFNKSNVVLSPKIGLSFDTLLRVYYSRNIFSNTMFQSEIGENQIGIEINIAVFQDLKIGL